MSPFLVPALPSSTRYHRRDRALDSRVHPDPMRRKFTSSLSLATEFWYPSLSVETSPLLAEN